MVELNFVILKPLPAMLASVVVSPHNAHHRSERKRSASNPPHFFSFSHDLCRKENGTNMAKVLALRIGELGWYLWRIIIWI
jgi:hypothetical protein